jgi:trimeric autotransporter adhesin
LKIALKGTNQSDETAVYFQAQATEGFDNQYDAFKVQTNAGVTLYTRIGNDKISINGMPDFAEKTEIPLIFYVPANGNYSLNVSELNYFAANSRIFLEDKIAKQVIDLQQIKSYSFAANVGTDEKRFVLRFSRPLPEITESTISIYPNPAENDLKIRFKNNYEGRVQIKITDLQGRELQSWEATKTEGAWEQHLKLSGLPKGLYILDIQTDKSSIIRKFAKE